MLSFATPLWLAGLLLVPVIRWLHRRGPSLRAVPVSSLGLWRRAALSSPAAGERRPPDPAWRRRALLAALLIIALADPQLVERRMRITVWVDDSLSMLTREVRGTRLVEGLEQVRAALAQVGPADVEVRTLANPWQSLGPLTEAAAASILAVAGQKEPAAPPPALVRGDSAQWLLTDGADAALFEWPENRRPDRTFRVGAVARNVGLERLSARRNLDDPRKYDLLLKIVNGGTATETRTVVFTGDIGEVGRFSHRLEPGAAASLIPTVPASAKVRAVLEPADALTPDDEIALDLDRLRRRRIAADGKCPGALVAAVRIHPALELVTQQSGSVDAVLDCGTVGAAPAHATVRVLADRTPTKPSGSLQWSSDVPASRRIALEAEFLQTAARLERRPGDTVLLMAADEPLIVSRAGTPMVLETAIDFESGRIAQRPEIPLLVDFLFGRLLGVDLLNEIATADRGPRAVIVAPTRALPTEPDRPAPTVAQTRDAARFVLVAALLVLLWEIVVLAQTLHRSGDRRVAESV